MNTNRIQSLTGIKGFGAIVIAFLVHYQVMCEGFFPFSTFFPFLSFRGFFFVEMFFLISGFGMTLGYEERIRTHAIDFNQYIKKRIFVFFPLHIISLVLCALFQVLYIHKMGRAIFYEGTDVCNFVLNCLLLQSGLIGYIETFNAPSWYLSVIVMIFVVYYVIVYHSKCKRNIFRYMGLIAIISIIVLYNDFEYPIFNMFTARGFLSYYTGMVIARLYQKNNAENGRLGFIGLVVILLSVVYYYLYPNHPFTGNLRIIYGVVIIPSLAISVIFNKILRQIFSSKLLVSLGNMSMEIFLLHYPVMFCIKTLDVYLGFNVDYKSRFMVFVYIVLVLCSAFIFFKSRKYINSIFLKILSRCTVF